MSAQLKNRQTHLIYTGRRLLTKGLNQFVRIELSIFCGLILVGAGALYLPFLSSPLVFDDKVLFGDPRALDRWLRPSLLNLRWISYASFAWTRELFGSDLPWFRLGNALLHGATGVVLFLFLRRLFLSLALTDEERGSRYYTLLAFFGGLIFAVHPVAVYAAGYLIQRSIVTATFFSLLMWLACLKGLLERRQVFLLVSAPLYYLALYSKELSVMAPAGALGLALMFHRPSLALIRTIAPSFLLYGIIAATVVFSSLDVIGSVYEPRALSMLENSFQPTLLPLSALNQSFLFFHYLLLWVIPNPASMSIDVRMPFPDSVFSFPQVMGPVLFVSAFAFGARLLLGSGRGETRLAGFGLIVPMMMFATEFSAVRLQEPFVLYRSYLWFTPAFAALPALAGRFRFRSVLLALAVFAALCAAFAWNRLTTLSDELRLWDDAAALALRRPELPGADRIFYNRGNVLLRRQDPGRALADYTMAIRLNPAHAGAYNNRGKIHFDAGRHAEALSDFRKAVELNPRSRRSHFGLGMTYLAIGQRGSAEESFRRSCELGFKLACARLNSADLQ